MKRPYFTIVVMSFATLMFAEGFCAEIEKLQNADIKLQESEKENSKVNLKIDEKTAIKLAEIILESRYGKEVLKQRPWNINDNGTSFKITGTLHTQLGGVAEIVISKVDARVIKCVHGK